MLFLFWCCRNLTLITRASWTYPTPQFISATPQTEIGYFFLSLHSILLAALLCHWCPFTLLIFFLSVSYTSNELLEAIDTISFIWHHPIWHLVDVWQFLLNKWRNECTNGCLDSLKKIPVSTETISWLLREKDPFKDRFVCWNGMNRRTDGCGQRG